MACRADDAREKLFLTHPSRADAPFPPKPCSFSVSWNIRKLLELLSDPIKVSVQKQKL